MSAPRLAVVLPVRDEEPVLGRVLSSLAEVLSGLDLAALEVVVVDDASRDRSAAAARAAWAASAPRLYPSELTVVSLDRPSGHQRALLEGFRRARAAGADLVFAMDADGQDDPAALPAMLARLAFSDVAFAERSSRAEPLWWRAGYAPSRAAFRPPLGYDRPYGNNCGFRARVAPPLLDGPPFRHLAAALAAGPWRVSSVRVARLPRLGGRAKMTPLALAEHAAAALAESLARAEGAGA